MGEEQSSVLGSGLPAVILLLFPQLTATPSVLPEGKAPTPMLIFLLNCL